MNLSKSIVLPMLGMAIMFFFIALSYFNNHIFLDKLLVCSFILTIVFIAKMRDKLNK